MAIFTTDSNHKNTCTEYYGAPADPLKPCACKSMAQIQVSTAELQQMAADGRGRQSVVRELAKNELIRRKP